MNVGTEGMKVDDCDELKFGGSHVIDDKKGDEESVDGWG
jgi:hypothetical protein